MSIDKLKREYKRRYCSDNSVINFITNNSQTSLINTKGDTKYLDKSRYPTSIDLKEKKAEHLKNMLLDATFARSDEALKMKYKDLLSLTLKACVPQEVKAR